MQVRRQLIGGLLCMASLTTLPQPAMAHGGAGSTDFFESLFELLFITSTTVFQLVTATGVEVAATTTPAINSGLFFVLAKGDDAPQVTEQLRLYMTTQRVQLLADLSLGAGQSLDDLATMGQVPHARHAEFCLALRQQRAALSRSLSAGEHIHTQQARRFASSVDEVLSELIIHR